MSSIVREWAYWWWWWPAAAITEEASLIRYFGAATKKPKLLGRYSSSISLYTGLLNYSYIDITYLPSKSEIYSVVLPLLMDKLLITIMLHEVCMLKLHYPWEIDHPAAWRKDSTSKHLYTDAPFLAARKIENSTLPNKTVTNCNWFCWTFPGLTNVPTPPQLYVSIYDTARTKPWSHVNYCTGLEFGRPRGIVNINQWHCIGKKNLDWKL